MTQLLRLATTSPVRGLRLIIGPLLGIANAAGPRAAAHDAEPAPWVAPDSDTALGRVEL